MDNLLEPNTTPAPVAGDETAAAAPALPTLHYLIARMTAGDAEVWEALGHDDYVPLRTQHEMMARYAVDAGGVSLPAKDVLARLRATDMDDMTAEYKKFNEAVSRFLLQRKNAVKSS